MIGLFVGLLYKFLDNIVVSYAHAVAMFITTIVSVIYFQFEISLEFICGLLICIVSMYLYHMEEFDVPQEGKRQDYQLVRRNDEILEENQIEVI